MGEQLKAAALDAEELAPLFEARRPDAAEAHARLDGEYPLARRRYHELDVMARLEQSLQHADRVGRSRRAGDADDVHAHDRTNTSAMTKMEEDDADDAVHVEEGHAGPRGVLRRHQAMLGGEQDEERRRAGVVQRAHAQGHARPDDEGHRRQVQDLGRPQRRGDAEPRRYRVHAVGAVERDVLEGVDDVEAGHPHARAETQQHRAHGELAGDGEPHRRRHDHVDRRQAEVAEPGEAFQVGIEDKGSQGRGPQSLRPLAEVVDGEEKEGQRHGDKEDHLAALQRPHRDGAARGTRIARVDLRVDEAVRRHRHRPPPEHRQGDPAERGGVGPAFG